MLSPQLRTAVGLGKTQLGCVSSQITPVAAVAATRHASHFTKNAAHWKRSKAVRQKTEYELSASEKRWKKQVDAMKEYIDSSPLKAASGKHFDPFHASSTMWGPLTPSWMSPGSASTKSYTETASFDMKFHNSAGRTPDISATSRSWNSATDQVSESRYDPISHRMVPLELLDADAKASSSSAFHSASASSGSVGQPKNGSNVNSPVEYSARSQTDAQDPNQPYDPYSKTPTGLQTAYRKEADEIASGKRPSLSEEMDQAMVEPEIDDGYGKDPVGMQTSYSKEHETGKSLEHELTQFERASLEAQRGVGASYVDEYTATPIGLEVSYKQEATEDQEGRSKLEHELFTRSKSFIEAERGLGSSHADEFPETLQGLQTSYQQEQNGGMSLEQELAQKAKEALEAQAGLGSSHHDEFPMASQGLQESYKSEQTDIESGKRVPLEQELSQTWNDTNAPPTVGESLKGRSRA